MKHLTSKRTGQTAENNLFKMVKGNRNKHRYVSASLQKFSELMNKIINAKTDGATDKLLLRLVYKEKIKNISEASCIKNEEKEHLKNACHTRYMKIIRKHKIPLNTGIGE